MKKLFLIFLFLITTAFGADMDKRKTIMIDLDGVLNMYEGKYVENKLPEVRKGAREFVEISACTIKDCSALYACASLATAVS